MHVFMSEHMRFWYILQFLKASLTSHSNILSGVRVLNFGPILHQHAYFVNVSNTGSGESEHLYRLA